MTTILNAVKDVYNGVERGKIVPNQFQYRVAKDVSNITNRTSNIKWSFAQNTTANLDEGTKLCPVSRECRNVIEGIT